MRPLVPRGIGTLARDVPYAVVPSHLELSYLINLAERIKRSKKAGLPIHWKEDAVLGAIETLCNNVSNGYMIVADARQTPEEVEFDFQENRIMYSQYRTKLPVYYVYTAHPDKEGCPADLTILARYSPEQRTMRAEKKQDVLPVCLYQCSLLFDQAEHWMHPFFVDANLDGETTWHRVMGLGRLNYDNDVDTEQFFNDAMAGARENLRRTYQVGNQGDWELIKRWNEGEFASNLLPPGVSVSEAAKNPSFQHALMTMDVLRSASAKNAGTGYGSSNAPTKDKELQIQALERQGRNAETMGNRIADIYECFDLMGNEIFRRMLGDTPLPIDPGYAEIKRFQDLCRADGVPVEILRKLFDVDVAGVVVRTNRTVGDGDKVREAMVNNALMNRIHFYSPQAQQIILRKVTASDTRDYSFAEEVVPYDQKPDSNQVARANEENNACMLRGITGYIPPYAADDIDAIHIQEHFGGMQALLAIGKASNGWTMKELGAFKVMGAHTAGHIQRIAQNPQAKALGTKLMQQLQQLARQGQEFANNLEKQQQQEQMDPLDAARLQLDQSKHQLNVRKQDDLVEHRDEVLKLNKKKQASGEMIAAAQLIGAERTASHNAHMDRVGKTLDARRLAHDMHESARTFDMQRDELQQQREMEMARLEQQQQQDEEPAAA
jgi:hypothetical protein